MYNTYDLNQQTTDDLRVLKATAYLTPKKWNENNQALMTNKQANAGSYLSSSHRAIQSLHGATYEVAMPIDYLHLLNCVCIYYVAKQKDCWDAGSFIEIPAIRLTADTWSQIVTDIYNRPSPMRPYYYIHNLNQLKDANDNYISNILPTNPAIIVDKTGIVNGTDMKGIYHVESNDITVYAIFGTGDNNNIYYIVNGFDEKGKVKYYKYTGSDVKINGNYISGITLTTENLVTNNNDDENITKIEKGEADAIYTLIPEPKQTVNQTSYNSNFPRTFKIDSDGNGETDMNVSLIEKPIALRAGNTSNVRMEIRYGKDDTLFQLKEVQVDYVKSPQYIRLTQEQIDLTEDTSQIMEFPDYVNQEIINELVLLVMDRMQDPRINSFSLISKSIASPAGQLAQPQPAQG